MNMIYLLTTSQHVGYVFHQYFSKIPHIIMNITLLSMTT